MRRITTTVVAGLFALGLTGCTVGASTASGPADVEGIALTPVVAVGTQSSGEPFLAALIQGDLSLTDQGCFGVKAADGTVTPVLFQRGTDVLSDLSGIYVPGYGDIRLGDRVSGGGGYVAAQGREDLDLPAECRSGEMVAILLS